MSNFKAWDWVQTKSGKSAPFQLTPDNFPIKNGILAGHKVQDLQIFEKPETKEMNYKFKVGDKVKIIESGRGCFPECIGEEVTILELGVYFGGPGYRTTETKGNSNANTGEYNYMIGENSFELVEETIPEYLECVNNDDTPDYGIIGRIYKFQNVSGIHWGTTCNLQCAHYSPGCTLYFNPDQLKPSTKEAYEAQVQKEEIPERISFYVKYCKEFTEDLYNKLSEWAKLNSKGEIRGMNDTYRGLELHGFYLFDNWGLNSSKYEKTKVGMSYGVDNNRQGCKEELSISELKDLINYKKSYKYEVVHCTTQEEWNFVNQHLDSKFNVGNNWPIYREFSCKSLNSIYYCNLDFYKSKNSKIYSFQEWCDKFGHKPEFTKKELQFFPTEGFCISKDEIVKKDYVGRYVKALVDYPDSGVVKKDEVALIKNYDGAKTYTADFPSQKNYRIDKNRLEEGKRYELLPEDYDPVKMKKRIEDFCYPDVVHVRSEEQLKKIREHVKNIYSEYNADKPYMLFGPKGTSSGYGYSDKPYDFAYNSYEFEDIIFPERIISGLKIGDVVMIDESQLPITDNWLGEGDRFTHQGPYVVEAFGYENVVSKLSGINCSLGFFRFRYATEEEKCGMKQKSLVGRYLKYIGSSTGTPQKGDYFRIDSMNSKGLFRLKDRTAKCQWNPHEILNSTSKHFELMPEGFVPPEVKLNPEDYIEEAKRRFPAETVFNNNNLIPDVINDQAVSSTPKYEKYREDEILVSTSGGSRFTIWKNGQWANVISKPDEEKQKINKPIVKETYWEPKVGDWAVITTLNSKLRGSMNGKIGHVFQIHKIKDSGFYEATAETWCVGECWPIDCIRQALPHEIPGFNKYDIRQDYIIGVDPYERRVQPEPLKVITQPSELITAKKSNQISAEVKSTKPLSFTIKQKSKTIKF